MCDTQWCDRCKNWIDGNEKQCPICLLREEHDRCAARSVDVKRERDAAQVALGKLYAGRPLSPAEHDLARDCLPQSALEGE